MTGVQHNNAVSPLDEILALSASMLELAHARDWPGVANLEAARNALLKAVFEGTARPAPELLAGMIQQVLVSDQALIQLGQQARDGVSAELARLRQSRKAHTAYAEHGSE